MLTQDQINETLLRAQNIAIDAYSSNAKSVIIPVKDLLILASLAMSNASNAETTIAMLERCDKYLKEKTISKPDIP